jgi:hypothetical protein
VGIVKCPCYFLSTFDDVTPSIDPTEMLSQTTII